MYREYPDSKSPLRKVYRDLTKIKNNWLGQELLFPVGSDFLNPIQDAQ